MFIYTIHIRGLKAGRGSLQSTLTSLEWKQEQEQMVSHQQLSDWMGRCLSMSADPPSQVWVSIGVCECHDNNRCVVVSSLLLLRQNKIVRNHNFKSLQKVRTPAWCKPELKLNTLPCKGILKMLDFIPQNTEMAKLTDDCHYCLRPEQTCLYLS